MINPNLKIDHVHLKVSNLERSLQFYRSILGFKIVSQKEKTAFLSSSSSSNNNDLSISLVVLTEIKNIATPYMFQYKPKIAGLYHFAILLPERRYLAYFLKHIQKYLDSEYYEGMADHAVSESIYLHDPDLNGIEVYSDRDPTEWKWKENTVHMITEPLKVQDLLKESSGANNEWNELPPGTLIGHIHLHVSNLIKSSNFYSEILGLHHTCSYPGANFFAADSYHHHIAINTWLGNDIAKVDPKQLGLEHFSLNLGSKGKFDELLQQIRRKKIEVLTDDSHRNNRDVYFILDPDKIKIQIYYQ